MMRSLFSGVSGMRNNQTRMDVSGNNIANVNTVGFKSGRVTFQDVLSQTTQGASAPTGTRGGTNPKQIGLGVGIASIDTMFTDGSFQPTGKATDLSIQGQGFFVLGDGSNQYYTRAGNFDFDTKGNFGVPGTGYRVQGWTADPNGVVNTSGAQPSSIQIPVGQPIPAKATDSITNANNLSASAKIGDTAMATIDIYDSQGTAHTAKTTYVKVGSNTWLANTAVSDVSGAVANSLKQITFDTNGKLNATTGIQDVSTGNVRAVLGVPMAGTFILPQLNLNSSSATGTVVTATTPFRDSTTSTDGTIRFLTVTSTKTTTGWDMAFSENGKALATSSILDTATTYPTPVTINGASTILSGSISMSNALTNNNQFDQTTSLYTSAPSGNANMTFTPSGSSAANMSLALDLAALTQYGGDTSVQATSQTGYAAGTLNSQSIDVNGNIVGGFTNGQTRTLAKICLATFNNPAGLTKVGSSLFAKSTNSGEPQVGTTGVGGRGTVNPGTLEMSNVDLAEEFSNMIITQRGFQANSRVITTTDTMLEELINLKR